MYMYIHGLILYKQYHYEVMAYSQNHIYSKPHVHVNTACTVHVHVHVNSMYACMFIHVAITFHHYKAT